MANFDADVIADSQRVLQDLVERLQRNTEGVAQHLDVGNVLLVAVTLGRIEALALAVGETAGLMQRRFIEEVSRREYEAKQAAKQAAKKDK